MKAKLRSEVEKLIILPLFLAVSTFGADSFPDISQLPAKPELPDPLVMQNGQRVASKEQWYKERRPELKALFQYYMYGYRPPAPARVESTTERVESNYFGGKATKKEVALSFGAGMPLLHVLMVVPNQRKKPAPVFVGINFHGNHALVADPKVALPTVWVPSRGAGATNNHATDAGRGTQADMWALEQSIDRGYAVASFYHGDVAPDKADYSDGIYPAYLESARAGRGPHEFGNIMAWAWGVSRVVDYLITDKDVDSSRIAVVGHSRNGKAAAVAAAFDERIGLAIPLQAGCGGTSPNRGRVGESVKQINDHFPHWFCDEYKKFNEQVERFPFDQHELIALIAPRPVLLSNATEDTWANPKGQFEMLQAADPVYRFLGTDGLAAKEFPPVGQLVASKLGYYIRPGKHSMTKGDWKVFLDFADVQFGKP